MNTKYTITLAIVVIAIILGSVVAYIYFANPSSDATINLNASGATFPQPFLNAIITAYSSIKSNVQINYQGGTTENIAATDDDGDLHTEVDDFTNLSGYTPDDIRIDTIALLTGQCFTAELEKYALVTGIVCHGFSGG